MPAAKRTKRAAGPFAAPAELVPHVFREPEDLAEVSPPSVGDALADLAAVDNDFGPEPEQPQPAPEPPDPVDLAADIMVERFLAATPGLLSHAAVKGAVVILVAAPHWQRPVRTAWRMRVFGEDRQQAISEDERRGWQSPEQRAKREKHPLNLIVDDDGRWKTEVDDDVRRALRIRRGILIACSDPEGEVSAVLRAAADFIIRVPPLTPADLAVVAEIVAADEAPVVADAVAAAVQPDELLSSLRPSQSAVDYVARVARMVAFQQPTKARPTARWTLDNLPLPPAVEAWGRQLAADLQAYAAGELAWAKVDRGALLWGPPGCGKTTFAQALAATCGVTLIATSYAVWEAGPDGKGRYHDLIPRMRQTFAEARGKAPCIIFIDELDSLPTRGQAAHNDSYFSVITNALLAELDGVSARDGVVVIAATNHPSRIDPALRRAGRLDRMLELELPAPSVVARILSAHLPDIAADDLLPIARSIGRMEALAAGPDG